MYDYKFRQSDLSFNRRKHNSNKVLLRITGLLLAAGAIYGIIHLGLHWKDRIASPKTESDIIPLQLPAHPQPAGGATPADRELGPPVEISPNRAVTDTANGIEDTSESDDNPGRGRSGDLPALQRVENGDEQVAQSPPSLLPDPEDALLPQTPVNGDAVKSDAELAAAEASADTVTAEPAGKASHDEEGETWIEHEVEPGDSLAAIFRDNGLSPQLLQRILGSGKEAKHLKTIRPEDKLRIRLNGKRQFTELHLQLDRLSSVRFAATDSGIEASEIRKQTRIEATAAWGTIDRTLFSSASEAGMPDAITMGLARIFGYDIDFALEIRPGDRFAVIYEELWADGEQVGSGDIIAAEFVNQGRSHRAIRFKDSRGKTDFYSPDGIPLKRTFFRTPVNFTRISSGFTKRRWHPVLRRWRAHKGVDYAAPTGTPVIATGDAEVEYRGWKRGYGRVVYLRHGSKYRTVYGHMSRFAKGLNKGNRVRQGEVIGYVGQSGLATGPHLHYEFHVNGIHRNPLTVKAPMADPLSPGEMKEFRETAAPLLASLKRVTGDRMLADAR